MMLRTKYSVDEVNTILKNKLTKDWKSQWDKSIYVGEVFANKFRYYYRKAYTKNSFNKEIVGKVYDVKGSTYIETKFMSGILRLKYFIYIWIIIGSFIFINNLITGGINNNILSTISLIVIVEGIVTVFMLFNGLIANALPTSKKYKNLLIDFLKEHLNAEVVS